MGAKFDAPEMSLEDLQEVMRREHPSIRNVNFRRIKIPTLLRGWFQNCTFTGCDFTDAEINSCFTDCSFYDLTAKRMCLTKSWFQGGTIADTRFEDCKVSDTVFAFVEAKNISIATTELEKCAFQGGNMDRVFFHHGIKASGIDGLESVAITMGGATEPEAHNHIRQIYRALLGPDCLQTLRLEYEELKRRYSKDIFSLIKSAEAAIPHNCHSCVFNGMQECAGQQAKDGLGFAPKCPCWEWEKGWRIQVQSFLAGLEKEEKV